ncbi:MULTISPECIES: hypothetical protein [unclassified Bradyrhizobium]|uniref:hypothetical protein n=1 Tax=Bradyrhizobium sp. USDA 4541 TaxID=2817704 RepID=UPI0020A23BFB|nr:hypothetical protein [Bradyrhizobium sp. USDA 4541]MCP1852817.1 hypothetical protein [Bradyrhizobium sp. USDA 4541]
MNRDAFRRTISALRAEARGRRHHVATFWIVCNGVEFTARAERAIGPVDLRTSRLSCRPRRALAAEALRWAAHYRRAAKHSPIARARNLEAARECIAEAAAYHSVFNRLP